MLREQRRRFAAERCAFDTLVKYCVMLPMMERCRAVLNCKNFGGRSNPNRPEASASLEPDRSEPIGPSQRTSIVGNRESLVKQAHK